MNGTGIIDDRADDALDASYAACHRRARRARSSFYLGFLLLDRPRRRAMEALYAFARESDDLVDSTAPIDVRRRNLAAWRAAVEGALDVSAADKTSSIRVVPPHGPPSVAGRKLLPALVDTVRRYGIPAGCLHAVLDGVQRDLIAETFETFDELADYCRQVASAVGRASLHIWGVRDPAALELADHCGLAFQLTNILRDLGEDAAMGRCYLPLEDLRACGYTREDLMAGRADARFDRLVRHQFARAEDFYIRAAPLYEMIAPDARRIYGLLWSKYRALLHEIARCPAAVLRCRVGLPRWKNTALIARWFAWPPRTLSG